MDSSQHTAAFIVSLVLSGAAGLVLALLCGALYVQGRRLRAVVGRLSESEARFRVLFEHGGVGLALLDPDGVVVQANPALERLLGHEAGELAGRRLADFAHPDDAAAVDSVARSAVDPAAGPSERERRFVRHGGGVVWARVLRVAVRDAGGLRFHVAALMDVTARRRAEDALAEERDFVAGVLHTADALIVVVDPEGRVLRFNDKCVAVSGYREDEVRGRPFWELLLPPHAAEAVRAEFARLIDQAKPAEPSAFENPWRTRTGEERLIAWRNAVARDADGRARHVIGVGLDVTEQRRLEAQLAQARKLETLAALVGGIAHDFNNQLTAVLGNLALLADDLRRLDAPPGGPGPRDLLPAAADAERAARRCADMTARLLTFSRGRVGSPQRLRLNELLPEAARLLREELPPEVRIAVEAPDDVWPVEADWGQLYQALHALAGNAREAMPEGGALTLALANREVGPAECAADVRARPGRFVELTVRDEGEGMTPEVQARLFEPFFTTRKAGRAAGLGLATAFGVIKGHKGWISVESAPGRGAAFHVFLPAAAAPPAPAREPSAAPARGRSEGVLVVDDEEMVRALAALVLERRGFRALTAAGGEEALALYRARRTEIDLVLLDYSMPGMNGLEVLEALKALDPEVCVVFSSGYAQDGDAAPLLAAGGRAFVPKPYQPDELVRALRDVLDGRSACA
jgi:PAS domain S-box-containing protein